MGIKISELCSHYEFKSQLITGRMSRLIEHLLGIYRSIGLAYLLFVYLANSFGPWCCRPLWGKLNCNYSQKFNSFCEWKSVYFQTRYSMKSICAFWHKLIYNVSRCESNCNARFYIFYLTVMSIETRITLFIRLMKEFRFVLVAHCPLNYNEAFKIQRHHKSDPYDCIPCVLKSYDTFVYGK